MKISYVVKDFCKIPGAKVDDTVKADLPHEKGYITFYRQTKTSEVATGAKAFSKRNNNLHCPSNRKKIFKIG